MFNELEAKMRVFETAHDFSVLPNTYMVARLDGKGFTKMTKKEHDFEKPFDLRFHELMVGTTEHLMGGDFDVVYAYTQSDEISLLFALHERNFARKLRKFNSVLAGEASAKFSMLFGELSVFDCRISQLPRQGDVLDYFRWRQQDAHRNALSAHCYWLLRKQGMSAVKATEHIAGKSASFKNELLFENGINFNELPAWQKRGVGMYWKRYQKQGWNPVKKETVEVSRRAIHIDKELPFGDAYNGFIAGLIPEED